MKPNQFAKILNRLSGKLKSIKIEMYGHKWYEEIVYKEKMEWDLIIKNEQFSS